MKYCAWGLALVLLGCGSSDENPATVDTPESSDPTQSPTADDINAARYPAYVSTVATPELLVSYTAPAGEMLPENQTILGDINGDGLPEMNVHVSAEQDKSYSAVIFGSADNQLPAIDTLNGSNGFVIENLRQPLTTIGDINGDGLDDISFYNSGWNEVPHWRVLAGASSFPAHQNSLEITSDELLIHQRLLTNVQNAGDIDGDGIDDLLFGPSAAVAPRVIYGATDLNLTDVDMAPDGGILEYCDTGFCYAHPVGDFDADGFDDLLVSRFSCGYSDYTAVLYGGLDGIVPRASLDEYPAGEITRLVSEIGGECLTGDFTGQHGDIDGDGSSDLLFKASTQTANGVQGRLLFGQSDSRSHEISIDELDGAKGFLIGDYQSLKITDVDNDGYADLLFPNNMMFTGRPRLTDSITQPVVRRGPRTLDVFWLESEHVDARKYRLGVNNTVSEYDLGVTTASFAGDLTNIPLTVSIEVLTDNDDVLNRSIRQVPADPALESLEGKLLAPRQIELTFNSVGLIKRYSHYLIWRNGIPIGRSLNGADNYIDNDLILGESYRYFITPDYLRNSSLEASLLHERPLLQRQSNIVELSTPDI